MKIISIRENPEYTNVAIKYIQEKWANQNTMLLYENCIASCINSDSALPHWYLLYLDSKIIGCAGLITNDFISRMDLYPWICSVFIDEEFRGNSYGSLLIEKAKTDAKSNGFKSIYLCTDHVGYYEHYGFGYLDLGYHPWGESSRIYKAEL